MWFKPLFLIISLGCINTLSAQGNEKNELLQEIISSQPTLSFSVKAIPKKVKKKYKETFNVTLNLSNPGANYNTTDVVYENEPIGMLLFLGTTSDNLGFFLYEIRGVTSQCRAVYYRTNRSRVTQMKSVILKKQPKNFEEMKQIIIDKEFL